MQPVKGTLPYRLDHSQAAITGRMPLCPRLGVSSAVKARDTLKTFPNPHPGRDYLIEHLVHEFTSLCPMTGQPDFARMEIRYVAGGACVELKSLKLYLQQYRSEGVYFEDVTNLILDDLASVVTVRRSSRLNMRCSA